MQGIRDNEQIKTKWLGVDDLGLNLQKIVLCSLCLTPAIVFYITALPIMQDFRDNEKNILQMTASHPFWIYF